MLAAIAFSASRTAATRSLGASRPESPRICSGSMCVSTSTVVSELGAHRGLEPVGDVVRGGKREAAIHFEVEGDGEARTEGMHGHMVHGERAVARNHHDALQHGLVVQRAGLGHDVDLGLRQRGGDRSRRSPT